MKIDRRTRPAAALHATDLAIKSAIKSAACSAARSATGSARIATMRLVLTFATIFITMGHATALTLHCEENLAEVTPVALPVSKSMRMELDESTRCRWQSTGTEATASILFSVPVTGGPIEIEIAARLDTAGTTATRIVMLDADFRPLRWIPHNSFRERKRHLLTRFFINPAENIRYILVGGASSAADDSLSRIYASTSTSLLNFAGLVTARELEADFLFVPSGEIRVRVREPKRRKVTIISESKKNAALDNTH